MRENSISAPPEVQDEITRAFAALKKHGYQVNAIQGLSGELSLDFKLGENEQTLKFTKDEYHNKGVIEKRIIDKLEI